MNEMADLFGNRNLLAEFVPPHGIERLLIFAYRSNFSVLIIFAFLFALAAIGRRVQNKFYHVPATVLALGITAAPTVYWSRPGSMIMFNLAVAFVMTATVFILNFVKLRPLDYAVLFSCFAFMTRFWGIHSAAVSAAVGVMPALLVFAVVMTVYKLRLGHLKGNVFYAWFTFMFVYIKNYAANSLFSRYVVRVGQARDSRIGALLVWGFAIFIVVAAGAAFVYLLKRLLKRHFDNINGMGKSYPQIERFFIYNSLAAIALIGLLRHYYDINSTVPIWYNPISEIFDLLLLLAMILQLSFLILVFRLTHLKDSLRTKILESQSLVVYSSGLEKNIDDIKHIKHDIKNIFLTMANFVEDSGNTEMQEFYRTKISPFAGEEIAKSDLYGKLAGVGNEQLKAFLFYKISQAIERGVDIDLEAAAALDELPIEFIDLVRILGILLDNAIEECMEIPGGGINIKISQNDEMTSVTIKNTVRVEVKERGIRPGISTKGAGRGKGLVTVRNIADKYDFMTLNSYFQGDNFVQSIAIYKFSWLSCDNQLNFTG